MDHLANLSADYCDQIKSVTDSLCSSIEKLDRASIVRGCSCLIYCLSDLLEDTLPDGVSITIK